MLLISDGCTSTVIFHGTALPAMASTIETLIVIRILPKAKLLKQMRQTHKLSQRRRRLEDHKDPPGPTRTQHTDGPRRRRLGKARVEEMPQCRSYNTNK